MARISTIMIIVFSAFIVLPCGALKIFSLVGRAKIKELGLLDPVSIHFSATVGKMEWNKTN